MYAYKYINVFVCIYVHAKRDIGRTLCAHDYKMKLNLVLPSSAADIVAG